MRAVVVRTFAHPFAVIGRRFGRHHDIGELIGHLNAFGRSQNEEADEINIWVLLEQLSHKAFVPTRSALNLQYSDFVTNDSNHEPAVIVDQYLFVWTSTQFEGENPFANFIGNEFKLKTVPVLPWEGPQGLDSNLAITLPKRDG